MHNAWLDAFSFLEGPTSFPSYHRGFKTRCCFWGYFHSKACGVQKNPYRGSQGLLRSGCSCPQHRAALESSRRNTTSFAFDISNVSEKQDRFKARLSRHFHKQGPVPGTNRQRPWHKMAVHSLIFDRTGKLPFVELVGGVRPTGHLSRGGCQKSAYVFCVYCLLFFAP